MLPTCAVSPARPPVTVALPVTSEPLPEIVPLVPAVTLIAPDCAVAAPVVATVELPVVTLLFTTTLPSAVLKVIEPELPAGLFAVLIAALSAGGRRLGDAGV